MLKTEDAGSLYREVKAAEEFRDRHLESRDEMIKQFTGSAYRSDFKGDWSENHMFEHLRLTASRVAYDNPKIRARSRRSGQHRLIAIAMRHGLNRWVRDVNFRRLLKRLYVSQSFGWAVGYTTIEKNYWEDPRQPAQLMWPMCYEIRPERFFFDPLALSFGMSRFSGHTWVRDTEDLLKEAEMFPDRGWNVGAIKAMDSDSGVDELEDRTDMQWSLSRQELVAYEIWVPEIQSGYSEDGFHGTIYTIGVTQSAEDSDGKAEFLREPRPYYGPRWGPYTLYGTYPVPSDPFPMGQFVAVERQMRELNDIVRAANDKIKDYKKLIIVSAENPDLAQKLNKPDSMVIVVKGFDPSMVQEYEIGGITDQHLVQEQQGRERLDRNTGISETHRGNLQPGLTATAISVADQSAEASISFVKQEFGDATIQMLKTVGWYMFHEDRIGFPLDEGVQMEDPETGEPMTEPWFFGGQGMSPAALSFDDLELEIEPYSMERPNEALVRAQFMEMMNMTLQIGDAIVRMPYFDWEKILDRAGDVINDPQYSDIFNAEIAAQMVGMQEPPFPPQQNAEFRGQQPRKLRQTPSTRGSSMQVRNRGV